MGKKAEYLKFGDVIVGRNPGSIRVKNGGSGNPAYGPGFVVLTECSNVVHMSPAIARALAKKILEQADRAEKELS